MMESWNPFRSNRWFDCLFEAAASNPITSLLWVLVSLWVMMTVPWYIAADIRHMVYGTPEPTLRQIVRSQIKMLCFEDAKPPSAGEE